MSGTCLGGASGPEHQDPNTEEQFRGKSEREQEWVASKVTVTIELQISQLPHAT